MKIRYFLLAISLFLTLGPLLMFRAWPHSEVLQGELDEVHERHLLLANNLAAALERYHRDLVTTFDLLLQSSETWADAAALNPVLENLSFRHICVADATSGKVLETLALSHAPCPDIVGPDTFARLSALAKPGAITFGPVAPGPNGENVMHMVKPMGDTLAIGAITTAYFRELGEAISFGVKGHAALVDNTGQALSHPLADWTASRKDMSKISAVQRMLNRETGVETFYSPALKGDMIAGFTFVDPVGWGVMIPQPLNELYQRAADARQSSIVVLLFGIVLALALALAVSLRVVRPLEQISNASSMIAGGDLVVPEPNGPARFLPIELKELQVRFYAMVRRLRENMSTIHDLAYVDSVTRLGNRTFLQGALDRTLKAGNAGAMFLIDLDGFKAVNDNYGHDVGDQVLEIVGQRLCDIVKVPRLGDDRTGQGAASGILPKCVARLGGDEFAIWVETEDMQFPVDLAEQMVAQIRAPILINGLDASVGASVGLAYAPMDGSDRASLIKSADLAMYDAKRAGKNQCVIFKPDLRAAVIAQRQLGQEIEESLIQDRFLPHFQPQFSLPDRHVMGVEALARWDHPERGLLPPSEFLETAQEIGVLHDIDGMILRKAVKQIGDLIAGGQEMSSLAVNLSEARLMSPAFLKALHALHDLPFELRFELVETMTLDRIDSRMAWTLDQIRDAGYKLDLDDFGAANASVLGLMNIEPSHLKIDRNLVFGMEDGNVSERLVRSIIQMGQSLGIPIIAEGAETARHLEILESMGCDFVQGFVLAKPMDCATLGRFLRDHNAAPRRA